ncbi:cilia- and flagella-associated protein 97 isoform X2 [Paralichthys olivaceus]|uniref:cilia- and flagella-associated protein 97 isoform X2 n=1 Tax=Paralichthys olivaceus TaxID=8255 RepID=UPI003750FD18
MFNPSEVEGEVDHSFFDSDADEGSISRGGEMIEHELQAKQTEKANDGLSQRTDGTEKQVNNNRSSGESKESSYISKEENNQRVSDLSSVASMSQKGISISSDSEEDYSEHSKRPNKTFMALLDEVNDSDMYNQSPNKTEEEASPSTATHLERRNKHSPKNLTRKWRSQSPSPTSAEEADSESCSRCNSSRSRTSHNSMKSSLSPRERKARVGSAGSRDMPTRYTEESDYTATDVSSLYSPDISPLQYLDLKDTEAEEWQESVPSSGLSDTHHNEDSDQDVDEFTLNSESQFGGGVAVCYAVQKNRKNYSFINEKTRLIGLENQRLLRVLSRISSRPDSTAKKETNKTSNSSAIRLNYSAINRQREQKRIDRENLAFLKRLESVKPTPGLCRTELLASYFGAPVNRNRPSPKKDTSTSRTKAASPRSSTSTNHSSRAVSIPTDSDSTPVPTSNKWCNS